MSVIDDFRQVIGDAEPRISLIEAALHSLEADLKYKSLIAPADCKTEDLSANVDASFEALIFLLESTHAELMKSINIHQRVMRLERICGISVQSPHQ